MESVSSVTEQNLGGLVPAEQMREMTTSPEEIKRRTKESLLESFMENMVKTAEHAGRFDYSANLRPDFDAGMLQEITDELVGLGYQVSTEEKVDPNVGPYKQLNISWV